MHIETLEDRRLFSVTVTEGYPGFYEIHGDASDDVINISVSQSGESFTLNETTYTSAAYIAVYAYAGNDTITIDSPEGAGWIGAVVSAGEGNDTVMLNFDGGVWAGAGNDIVHLTDAYTGTLHGEDGDDQLYVSGASVDVDLRGGNGDDLIDASANYAGLTIHGDLGNDTIHGSEYGDEIHGAAGADVLYGHGGNDVFYARDRQHDEIYGGGGADIAYVDLNGDGLYEIEYAYFA